MIGREIETRVPTVLKLGLQKTNSAEILEKPSSYYLWSYKNAAALFISRVKTSNVNTKSYSITSFGLKKCCVFDHISGLSPSQRWQHQHPFLWQTVLLFSWWALSRDAFASCMSNIRSVSCWWKPKAIIRSEFWRVKPTNLKSHMPTIWVGHTFSHDLSLLCHSISVQSTRSEGETLCGLPQSVQFHAN